MQNKFPFQPAEDTSAALWMTERLEGVLEQVTSIVPKGYEAYARMCHPAWLHDNMGRRLLTWHEIAAQNDRIAHRQMQWYGIAAGHPLLDHDGYSRAMSSQPDTSEQKFELPSVGTLPLELIQPLQKILTANTASPDTCWFALWEGFGTTSHRSSAILRIPARAYYLFCAPLKTVEVSFNTAAPFDTTAFHQTANLWWPNDKAWCVATEVDAMFTYVGGTKKVIHEIISTSVFEADFVEPSDSLSFDFANTKHP